MSAAQVDVWRSTGANQVRIAVAQIGAHAVSSEIELIFPL